MSFGQVICYVHVCAPGQFSWYSRCFLSNKIFRCLYRRCLPLPIPNRAVKPARADGIAVTGGRVGRCLFLHGSPCWKQSRAFFVIAFSPGLPQDRPVPQLCIPIPWLRQDSLPNADGSVGLTVSICSAICLNPSICSSIPTSFHNYKSVVF